MSDVAEIAGHVKDADFFDLPLGLDVHLPTIHVGPVQVPTIHVGPWDVFGYRLDWALFGYELELKLQITKFMVLELLAAVLMILIFVPLAWRIRSGRRPRGRFWNLFEVLLVFIRDDVARPAIGREEADRFLPYLWNLFFFILFCNLLGLVPWAGSPTGALAVTGALAMITLCTVTASGMAKLGVAGYWTGMVPHIDLPLVPAILLKPLILGLEVLGLCIRHGVLAVRLVANVFAGHAVLAIIMLFISWSAGQLFVLWAGVTTISVLGAVALSLLELFVAFLQAYVFTFLTALFIGMARYPH